MSVERQPGSFTAEQVEEMTILRSEVGSTVLGLETGSGDRDEMGVLIEPPDYVLGLRHFENYVHRTQPEGVRSGPGDLDLTVYGLRKFCSLALKGNPSILLLFMVPDEKCVVLAPLGEQLRALAPAFASKKAGAAFLGYMEQQRKRLTGEIGQKNVKRPELVDAHGYDTKYAGHILRLGYQGIEYMQTGRFSVPTPVQHREFIRDVRFGRINKEDVLNTASLLEAGMKLALNNTQLPDLPDYARVNDFLIYAYGRQWGVRL